MSNILHIVGNRPQFIKLAMLHQELSTEKSVKQQIIHTGQHSSNEMSGIFFKDLSIPDPDQQLGLSMEQGADYFLGNACGVLRKIFEANREAKVIVYGDTTTTLAGAIAAKRSGNLLYHVESGIRTGDQAMPEEINRVLTDRLASVNYCCTQDNHRNMLAEGYASAIESRLVLSGDLMYDAYLKIQAAGTVYRPAKEYVVCTIHRAGNILSKEKLKNIVNDLETIHQLVPVVMPVHPHTKKRLEEFGINPQFMTIPAIGYPEMKTLVSDASFVITDSGGTAREAYFSQKRSVVVMDKPFWPEIIKAGCSVQANGMAGSIINSFTAVQELEPDFNTPLFGTGRAAEIIKHDILAHLS